MSHIINYIFILYILLSTYAKKITTEYNFGEYQDPDIDKSYNHLLGRNIYFVTEVPEKSFYITVLYPPLTSEVESKLYTDSA